MARFVLLSASSLALNLGLTIGLREGAGVPEEAAFAVALATVLATNFLGLRYFVYPGRGGPFRRQFGAFLASSAGFRGLEYLAFLALHTGLGLPYRPVLVAVLASSFLAKFFYYGAVVFARRAPSLVPSPDGPR